MKFYQTKAKKIGATRYADIIKRTRKAFHDIEKKTKRRPYARSAYFNKEKIFFDYFWTHLAQASFIDRRRRLPFFPCAIELIERSRFAPVSGRNPRKKNETLHRFAGSTPENELFYVQIKEDLKTGQKFLMSVFPE
jgi:hypothetical protein